MSSPAVTRSRPRSAPPAAKAPEQAQSREAEEVNPYFRLRMEARAEAAKRHGHLPTWWRRRDDIAAIVSKSGGRTSDRTLRRVKLVVDRGCPELIEAMNEQIVSIAAAAVIAQFSPDNQRDWLGLPYRERKATLRALRLALARGEI